MGRFLGRDLYGVPLNIVLQYVAPVVAVPVLMLFKFGQPRGYIREILSSGTPNRTSIVVWNRTANSGRSSGGD